MVPPPFSLFPPIPQKRRRTLVHHHKASGLGFRAWQRNMKPESLNLALAPPEVVVALPLQAVQVATKIDQFLRGGEGGGACRVRTVQGRAWGSGAF